MGHMKKLAAVVAAGVLIVACGDDDGDGAGAGDEVSDTIEVTGTDDLRFDPDEFVVAAGTEVTVEMTAEELEHHDFVIEDVADVGRVAGSDDMNGGDHDEELPEGDLEVLHVDEGETATGAFTIDEPGTYTVYCSVPGHRAAGMEATLEVVDVDA